MKSVGRLARSVAMMTHRPVMGSFRNSGNDGESSGRQKEIIAWTAGRLRQAYDFFNVHSIVWPPPPKSDVSLIVSPATLPLYVILSSLSWNFAVMLNVIASPS